MPIPEIFKPVIAKLVTASKERRINWTEGPADLTYTTSLTNFTLRVQSQKRQPPVVPPPPKPPAPPLQLQMTDAHGQVIEAITLYPEEAGDYAILAELFEQAKQSYQSSRRLEDKIIDVLKELDSRLAEPAVNPEDIVSASWGASGVSVDVVGKLRTLAPFPNRHLASEKLFGDPCVGKVKKLTVRVRKGGTEREVIVAEGQPIELTK